MNHLLGRTPPCPKHFVKGKLPDLLSTATACVCSLCEDRAVAIPGSRHHLCPKGQVDYWSVPGECRMTDGTWQPDQKVEAR